MLMLVLMAHRHLREEPYCWPERRRNRLHDEEISRSTNNRIRFGVQGFVNIPSVGYGHSNQYLHVLHVSFEIKYLLKSYHLVSHASQQWSPEYFICPQDVKSSSRDSYRT